MIEPRPCVCGGLIRPRDETDEAIAAAVMAHQRMPPHVSWRIGVRVSSKIAYTNDGGPVLVPDAN